MLFCYAQQRNYDYASNVLNVPIKRLDPTLPLPKYAQLGDAGCDLIAAEQTVLQPSGGRALIATGIAIALPEGYAALILYLNKLIKEAFFTSPPKYFSYIVVNLNDSRHTG